LTSVVDNRAVTTDNGVTVAVDEATVQRVTQLVGEIERLRAEALGRAGQPRRGAHLMAVADRARDGALRRAAQRRGDAALHQNLSKASPPSWTCRCRSNEITAAERAIRDMLQLLDKKNKDAAIRQSIANNQAPRPKRRRTPPTSRSEGRGPAGHG